MLAKCHRSLLNPRVQRRVKPHPASELCASRALLRGEAISRPRHRDRMNVKSKFSSSASLPSVSGRWSQGSKRQEKCKARSCPQRATEGAGTGWPGKPPPWTPHLLPQPPGPALCSLKEVKSAPLQFPSPLSSTELLTRTEGEEAAATAEGRQLSPKAKDTPGRWALAAPPQLSCPQPLLSLSPQGSPCAAVPLKHPFLGHSGPGPSALAGGHRASLQTMQ